MRRRAALALFVLGFNLMGDGLRDLLDSKVEKTGVTRCEGKGHRYWRDGNARQSLQE